MNYIKIKNRYTKQVFAKGKSPFQSPKTRKRAQPLRGKCSGREMWGQWPHLRGGTYGKLRATTRFVLGAARRGSWSRDVRASSQCDSSSTRLRTLCQPRKGCGTRRFKCPSRSGEALRRQQPKVVSSATLTRQEASPPECQTARQTRGRLCHLP